MSCVMKLCVPPFVRASAKLWAYPRVLGQIQLHLFIYGTAHVYTCFTCSCIILGGSLDSCIELCMCPCCLNVFVIFRCILLLRFVGGATRSSQRRLKSSTSNLKSWKKKVLKERRTQAPDETLVRNTHLRSKE